MSIQYKYRLEQDPLWAALPGDQQQYLLRVIPGLRPSVQYQRQLIIYAADLHMWGEPGLQALLEPVMADEQVLRMKGSQRTGRIMTLLGQQMEALRTREIDYSNFTPHRVMPKKHIFVDRDDSAATLMGRCPVAGEKTRCCNLLTLDAVRQCGYACSYCSIQSFYDEQQIFLYPDLGRRLRELDATLKSDRIYHIGTGQSSDSLMFGNQQGMLDDLLDFARDHPQVILELKSKSDRIEPLLDRKVPRNVLCTWSLNPQTVITKEEHLTASLDRRLSAARSAADHGILVGFHLHPIVRFLGWQEAYGTLIDRIQELFTPREIVMVSMGTLTYIKPVIRRLRQMGIKSKVLQIPLADASGKLSYPPEVKQELFSFAYRRFNESWRDQVFFYLCMEPPELWMPVLGRSYPDNDAFEADMKQTYMERIRE